MTTAHELAPVVEFLGETYRPTHESPLTFGRVADVVIDSNQYLHRQLGAVLWDAGTWWLANTGSGIGMSLSAGNGSYQAWVGPGVRVPLVFDRMVVVFTAGAYTYELVVSLPDTPWREAVMKRPTVVGSDTIGPAQLTESQKLLVLSLAEPLLRDEGSGVINVPSSARAAERLGWPVTTFNRKLDTICEKLDRRGVTGLRGGPGAIATQRKSRLVEYAVLSRLVVVEDLPMLESVVAAVKKHQLTDGREGGR